MATISIRQATTEDDGEAAAVDRSAIATLRKTYRPTRAALDEQARRSAASAPTRLVAIVDHQVVGTVQYFHQEDRVHLLGLGVHDRFQRQGVARALVEHLMTLGREHGARCLSLHTVKETGNVMIFRKMGFDSISEGPDAYSESKDFECLTDIYMEKSCE
ncbi:MAG: GNAT family N-acetyltransferase [Planctomycetota bacterium]|nr:GNAT family N-acetyltransferase [Planctomycetota bacterium]